jgi:hypothetical protein
MVQTGPTSSESSNRLLELAERVSSGAAGLDELQQAIAAVRANVEAARADFTAAANAAAFPAETEAARTAFEAYLSALDALGQGGETVRASQGLITATDRVMRALSRYDEAELEAAGPTRHAEVNMTARLARMLEAGEVSPDDFKLWLEHLERSLAFYPPSAAEARSLRAEGIESLRGYIDSRDSRSLEAGLDKLERAADDMQVRLPQLLAEVGAAGPTRYAQLNLVIKAIRDIASGALALGAHGQVVDTFSQWLDAIRLQMLRLEVSPPNVPRVRQLLAQLRDTVGVFDSLLAQLYRLDSPAAAQVIDDEMTLYTDAAEDLSSLEEEISKLPAPTQEVTPGAGTSTQVQVPQEFDTLLRVAEQVAAQQAGAPELERAIAAMEALLDRNEHQIDTQVASSERLIEATEASDVERQNALEQLARGQQMIREGSSALRNGMRYMARYLQTRKIEDLSVGVRSAWQGMLALYEVHRGVKELPKAETEPDAEV